MKKIWRWWISTRLKSELFSIKRAASTNIWPRVCLYSMHDSQDYSMTGHQRRILYQPISPFSISQQQYNLCTYEKSEIITFFDVSWKNSYFYSRVTEQRIRLAAICKPPFFVVDIATRGCHHAASKYSGFPFVLSVLPDNSAESSISGGLYPRSQLASDKV